MSWSNQTKNISALVNLVKGSAAMTWDEATFIWNAAIGTWSDPWDFNNQSKNISAFTNQAKNS